MTEEELNQLHWINKELKILKEQLMELNYRSLAKGKELKGMPFSTKIGDITGDIATDIREVEELMEKKVKELWSARVRIEQCIDSIQDGQTRLIIRLRCINNMTWEDIAAELMVLDNNGNVIKEVSRQTVTRRYKEFLKKIEKV